MWLSYIAETETVTLRIDYKAANVNETGTLVL